MINSNFKNANILVVDDRESNIDILVGLLEIQGYTNIESTTDPRLVVDLYRTFAPDLILLDLMMPHLTGYQVMQQLKDLVPGGTYLPILVLTADMSTEAKQRALTDGAKDFLAKPFDLIEVGLRINNLLFARYLHLQLQNQNVILEEKVKERTLELEKINIDLIVARDKAQASDRLKTAFLNNISHEIRTPLNGILGMYSMLTDPLATQEEKELYYKHLQSSSDRLIKTVTDYLDIALLVSGNMEMAERAFFPSSILEKIYYNFQHESNARQLTLLLRPPSSEVQIKSDPVILQKALSHLVDNAIKFTSEGTVSFGFEQKEDQLEFYVTDTGTGIDESAREIIFDHFIQENHTNVRGYEGSGLGLTIAKKMVEMLGGSIRLNSVKEKGSTFYLTIPFKTEL